MSLRDDINIPVIVVLGLTTGLIVAVAIVGTKAGYNYVTQVDLARNYATAEGRGLNLGKKTWAPQAAALNGAAAWADVEKKTVRIPLEDAMNLMISTKGKPPVAKPSAEALKKADAQPAAQTAGPTTAPTTQPK